MVFKYGVAFILVFVRVLDVVNGRLEASTLSSPSFSFPSSSFTTKPGIVSCNDKYEILNPSTGKCDCKPGFSGWGCQMCDSNEACEGIDKKYQCVDGLFYSNYSNRKTYACDLDPSVSSLFPDSALTLKCDRTAGSCSVAIFKADETAGGEHMIDCSLVACKFEDGSANGSCGLIECKCGKSCSTMTKQIVEKSLSGKPIKITVEDSMVNLDIEDSPIPLAAVCKASACEIYDSNLTVFSSSVKRGLRNSTVLMSSSSSSASSEPQSSSCDEKYEILNPSTGKCECKPGFSGWGCQMCDSNESCQEIDKNYQCASGLVYSKTSDHKTYSCVLDASIKNLLPDGELAIKCDRAAGSCNVAIFKTADTIFGEHILDCSLTTCKFEDDSAGASCGLIECKCGKSCSTLMKQIVEKSLSGKPVKVTAQNTTLHLDIEDAPIPLAAVCKASACEVSGSSGSGSSSSESRGWSKGLLAAVITCAVIAAIILLCVLGCSCFVSTRIKLDQKDVEAPPLSSMPGRVLEFNQLSCRAYVKEGKKKPLQEKLILQDINGKVTRGSVLGLLGPSGSGKTSLLNALAAVENGKSTFTGEILVDQQRISRDYRKIAAYVQQDDSLYSTLTVRECIQYSAHLRLSSTISYAAKEAMVDRVIDELNLTHVANSRIGSSGTARGISGGERRRVSIGMELVTSPMILFLDEPTSGLDSSSSNSVVQLVNELANHGRIVVLSIHQPSSKAFHLLDQVMLLAKGEVLYYGAPQGAKEHFEKFGFICPENENTADFILDVAADLENIPVIKAKRNEAYQSPAVGMSEASPFIKSSNAEVRSIENSGMSSIPSTPTMLSPIASGALSPVIHSSASQSRILKKATSSRSYYIEMQVLFRRTAQNIYRHRSLLMLHVMLSIALGLFGGLIFNHVTNDLAGFQNRSGAFYFILTFFGFSSMSSMDLFIAERPIFLRETGAMYYGAFSYFLAKATLDAVSLRILPATIFACIFYWIMGLQPSIEHFVVFIVTLILFNVAAGSISILIGVISRSVGAANLSATVVFLIMLLFGGFLLNSQTMPSYVGWLKHFSIFSYAFEVLMTNELKGLLITFNAPGYPSIPVYGDVFLKTLGMNYENRFYDMIALVVIAFALQLLSFLFLSLQVPPRSEIFLEGETSSTENETEPLRRIV